MFDVDNFITDCQHAIADGDPRLAIKDVLQRALDRAGEIADALPPDRAELVRLHVSAELTILKLVWGPGMVLRPHDHRMWAAIGIYTGGEDNAFYRRAEGGLAESGGKSLRPGDVCLLGDDVIHGVTNPTQSFAGAIHVYGGDFFSTPRSEWAGPPYKEQPFDVQRLVAQFDEANHTFAEG